MSALEMIREGFDVWTHNMLGGDMISTPVIFALLFLFGFLATGLLKNVSAARRSIDTSAFPDTRAVLDAANTQRLHELESDIARHKATLNGLTETLSTTFAHMSAGLAIFNADETLHLFNPALSDSFDLDPVWLAGRPSLSSFLCKLRETRNAPEIRDFREWRGKFTEFRSTKNHQRFARQWVLPDGRIFHVTAQPHPKGAVALVFENVTERVLQERKHRRDENLNGEIFNQIAEAVAVVDTTGSITFANALFGDICDFDISDFDQPRIDQLKRSETARKNAGFWSKVQQFASSPKRFEVWKTPFYAAGHEGLLATICALSGGATLIRIPADKAMNVQEMRVKLDGFGFDRLANLLHGRGFELCVSNRRTAEHIAVDKNLRRVLWLMAISATSSCREGGEIHLDLQMVDGRLVVSSEVGAGDIVQTVRKNLARGLLQKLSTNPSTTTGWSITTDKGFHRLSIASGSPQKLLA